LVVSYGVFAKGENFRRAPKACSFGEEVEGFPAKPAAMLIAVGATQFGRMHDAWTSVNYCQVFAAGLFVIDWPRKPDE
jgi:hypothetical protein